jgi:transcriptional regulator with XRE-family HTH domain
VKTLSFCSFFDYYLALSTGRICRIKELCGEWWFELWGFALTVNIKKMSPPSPASDDSAIVTVTDVARAAGVSVSTVSRIVNGSARVSADKRLAVEAMIARMGFRPNLHARSLKMGRSMTIGMLAQDIESPFFTRVIRGIEEAFRGAVMPRSLSADTGTRRKNSNESAY